jgi:hypothetical protein
MKRAGLLVSALCLFVVAFALLTGAAQAKTTRSFFPGKGAWPSMITYYTVNDGTNFLRSTKPFRTGVATQNHRANRIKVAIHNSDGYADSGVVVYSGKLARLSAFTLKGSGQFGLNLWFDVDKDGQYFTWDGNVYTGVGGDTYGLGPASVDGTLTVDGASPFFMVTAPNGPFTLDQLKAGAFPGIDSDTHVAVWVGVSGSETSSTIAPPKNANKHIK